MITKLPEWYKLPSLVRPDSEVLESISNVIASIINKQEVSWFYNCIRLYLNKTKIDQEFINDFRKHFLDNDPLFQQKDNELELRVLAGAIINEYINCDKYTNCISIALALISCSFRQKDILNEEIVHDAKVYINKKSIDHREHLSEFDFLEEKDEKENDEEDDLEGNATKEELNTKIENIKENLYSISQINVLFNILNNKIRKLEEESNIHWWIFRGYSNQTQKLMKELNFQIAPIILGMELCDLTTIIPGPIASSQFLKKVMSDNFTEHESSLELKDVINKTDKDFKKKMVIKYQETNLGNICPLMYAYSKALEAEDEKSWISFFEKKTSIKSKSKIKISDLSYQSYIENLLIKSLG